MNDEKKAVKGAEAGRRAEPQNQHVDVLYRTRALRKLQLVERLIKLCEAELGSAQLDEVRTLGDEQLMSVFMHAQNWVTQSRLNLPDLGEMERHIDRLRLRAIVQPAPREDAVFAEHIITNDFGTKARTTERGANVRLPEGVAV